jgi:transposase InsO family protein
LVPHIERVWHANRRVFGADKVWKQLNREGISIARCTVERLMQRMGLQGVRRGKVVRTTNSDMKAVCPLDRVNRLFLAERSAQPLLLHGLYLAPLWVSDGFDDAFLEVVLMAGLPDIPETSTCISSPSGGQKRLTELYCPAKPCWSTRSW